MQPVYDLGRVRLWKIRDGYTSSSLAAVEVIDGYRRLEATADPRELVEVLVTVFEQELLGEPGRVAELLLERLKDASASWAQEAYRELRVLSKQVEHARKLASLDPEELLEQADKLMREACNGAPGCTVYEAEKNNKLEQYKKAKELRTLASNATQARQDLPRLEKQHKQLQDTYKRLVLAANSLAIAYWALRGIDSEKQVLSTEQLEKLAVAMIADVGKLSEQQEPPSLLKYLAKTPSQEARAAEG